MKNSILSFLILFFSGIAFADCAGSGTYFWPTGNELPENPIIMIEGYYQSEKLVAQFGKSEKVYLQSSSHRVPLEQIALYEGEMDITQVVLKPTSALNEGETYTFIIDSRDESGQLKRYIQSERKYGLPQWQIKREKISTLPSFTGSPEFTGSVIEHYGCGPGRWMYFDTPVQSDAIFLIKVTLEDLKSGNKTTYLCPSDGKTLAVGHGMCSGAFIPKMRTDYRLLLQIVDIYYNKSRSVTVRAKYSP